MVFSSLTFLFVFLPLCIITYFLIPPKYTACRKYVLTAFSIAFYAIGEPVYVILLVASVTCVFFMSNQVEHQSKIWLVFSVVVVLMPLLFFKYLDFVIDNLNAILSIELKRIGLPLPIGISFYTFQMLTYVIDLYRRKVKRQENIGYLTLYVFFFPQLIAGPIVRYIDIEDSLRSNCESWEKAKVGTGRFIIGLTKKVLIADQAGFIVDRIASVPFSQVNSSMMWLSSLAFTLQLFFDFSGYSDMAIGLGKIFGFDFKENFNHPYSALSITDFWRRWHISMNTFFRDYVYIPMGGNRCSRIRWIFNILVVWILTGFWHGAKWNFAVWGLFYAFLLMLEKLLGKRILNHLPPVVSWFVTFFLTIIGWTIFMFDTNSLSDIIIRLQRLFSNIGVNNAVSIASVGIKPYIVYLLLAFVIATPIGRFISEKARQLSEKIHIRSSTVSITSDIFYILLFLLCVFFIVGGTFSPFIYFRF